MKQNTTHSFAGRIVLGMENRPGLLSVLLFLLVFGVFLPVLGNGFVNYDDPRYLLFNVQVRTGFTWEGVQWAFGSYYAGNWHPLTWLSHMADCQTFGLEPWGHHLVSVAVHALNTALVFVVFRAMTGAVWRSLFLALLFGLHPLRVESVAWAAERKDVLAALFWLLTMWAYAGYVKVKGSGWRAAGLYALVLLFFALGLMSKPMLVTLPLVLLLLDYWPLNRWPDAGVRRLVLEKVPLFVLTLISIGVTLAAQGQAGAVKGMTVYPLVARLENAVVSGVRYMGKFVWPVDLAVFYPHPGTWPLPAVLGACVLLLGITAAVLVWGRKQPWLPAGWFWFAVTLVPVIGLVQVGAQAMADRYTYIPSIGLGLVVVWGAHALAEGNRRRTLLLRVAAPVILAAFAFLTVRQEGCWKDSESLFRHALAATGANPVAEINLGIALGDKGAREEAIRHLEEAVHLEPGSGDAWLNLGVLQAQVGRRDEAVQSLGRAILLDPTIAGPHHSLGIILGEEERYDEAIFQYREAIRIDPAFSASHNNLGVMLQRKGLLQEAVREYREALRLDPDNIDAHINLGILFYDADHLEEAVEHFSALVRLRPDSAEAHNRLGSGLSAMGRIDAAIVEYKEALRLDPTREDARKNLEAVEGLKKMQSILDKLKPEDPAGKHP